MGALLPDVELLRRLVAFDTTSRESNLPLAEFLCDYLDRPGVRVARNPSEDGRKANLVIAAGPDALADTGTLVVMSSAEPRLASLLPPVHIAVIESSRILSGLDELLTKVPLPADSSASMVLITGPSRTADIEQILVRGVHGPGELHVVIVE